MKKYGENKWVIERGELEWLTTVLCYSELIAFDTETTGLGHDDRAFCLILADETSAYFIHWGTYEDHMGFPPPESCTFHPSEVSAGLFDLFENKGITWCAHNAKFDLLMLAKEGIQIKGSVWCTQAMERLVFNQHPDSHYSLHHCAKRRGWEKLDIVEEYIKKNKLYEKIEVPGKKGKKTKKFFHRVPFDILAEYGLQDGRVHYDLAVDQMERLGKEDEFVEKNEMRFTKNAFEMERLGIRFDLNYAKGAMEHEKATLDSVYDKFERLFGEPYDGSRGQTKRVFEHFGIPPGETAKGNESFSSSVLEKHAGEYEIATVIDEIRYFEKRISTYYSTILEQADERGVIYPSIMQSGTGTGRMSYREPNMQNFPKEKDKDLAYYIRGCVKPPFDGWYLVPIDWDQQEFRLLLDYAGEEKLIRAVMEHGEDLHQATADIVGLERDHSKTLSFGLLYGMGVKKLAKQLSVSEAVASEMRGMFFSRLPRVRRVIREMIKRAERRGYVWTWSGRKLYFPDREKCYKAPNHIIQGGCGDIIKLCVNEIREYMRGQRLKSRPYALVHDEIVFAVPEDELEHVQAFKEKMENAYAPQNGMKLTCSVEYSKVSWSPKELCDGIPERKAV